MSSRPSRGAARLAAILDALPDGLVLVNCNGTVVNANTIALEMFESPGTGLVGRGVLDLLPTFDSKLIPGSMRRPESEDEQGRTKPTRMVARRTDGSEFPVEVTSANLEDGRDAYASPTSTYGGASGHFSGDELLMIVVRDLSGTVDTEAELARSQRQTEMILRAASEGVVGTDTDGRVVLVNPAAAQILGYRASDLGGQELHPLVLHSRGDGEPFPYEESPLADTLKSGRKHRVRGQVLWAKSGASVPVDLTTAPVRDGDLLVGAVMTFTDRRPYEDQAAKHAEILERETSRHAEVLERETSRYDALSARHQQLLSVLGGSLRGPLDELRRELSTLAADDAGQLWPEANQVLHHLAAGYARMTTLVDNVLAYQRLDSGTEQLKKAKVLVGTVVTAGVEGAIELIGPGRAQFAVHAPPIEAEIDPARLATALAHLVADVAGVDATGNAPVGAGGYMDSTVVVAAAVRGEVVRIEVRGPYAGGDPVHEPIVRGIVAAHDGVLQTVEVPGMSGSAYVLEVPLGEGAGSVPEPAAMGTEIALMGAQEGVQPSAQLSAQLPAQQGAPAAGSGRRRARRASTDAFLESPVEEEKTPTGRRRARAQAEAQEGQGGDAVAAPAAASGSPAEHIPSQQTGDGPVPAEDASGTGRRRGRPSPAEDAPAPAEGSVVTAAESERRQGAGRPAALSETVPPQGMAADPDTPSGRRARRVLPAGTGTATGAGTSTGTASGEQEPSGRRARRALAAAPAQPENEGAVRTAFALPPAEADRTPQPTSPLPAAPDGRVPATGPAEAHRPLGNGPVPATGIPTSAPAHRPLPNGPAAPAPVTPEAERTPLPSAAGRGRHDAVRPEPDEHTPPQPHPVEQQPMWAVGGAVPASGPAAPGTSGAATPQPAPVR
ncbi:PAS domain-containing protein, partial [Streptomyces sp. CBMA152]|uniref:PAS domain-containing protein n=1 Tax=Streptomyces sp. CBMA152 TaxID=1896312 RepID=UPI001660C55F